MARDPDLSILPADLNPKIRDLIQRCLKKDVRRRWQAIGDVRIELEAIASSIVDQTALSRAPRERRFRWSIVLLAGLLVVSLGVAVVLLRTHSPSDVEPVRLLDSFPTSKSEPPLVTY